MEVNSDWAIIIEDKINSAEHSEQLLRYKQTATDHYKDKQRKLVFIYLKTGNESMTTLKEVIEKGFAVVDRKSILTIFNQRHSNNQIFVEFKEHLTEIENQTNSYGSIERITSVWAAAEGFFMALQEQLQVGDWRYVANPNGGFLGFWYHFTKTKECTLYIQIENAVNKSIEFNKCLKLAVKIGGDWKQDTSTLNYVLGHLRAIAPTYGLTFIKPDRHKPGKTSTIATVDNAFPTDSEGKFDPDKFVTMLRSLEQALDNYCEQENKKHSRQQGITAGEMDAIRTNIAQQIPQS